MNLHDYLQAGPCIDWREPAILDKAAELAEPCHGRPCEFSVREGIARACFEFVRDHIRHSLDFECNPVTWRASQVLKHRSGYCYAKSHLLAALLRANDIPAGLCYQRLAVGEQGPPFCLHGLNAVYLEPYGWYRIDARGNKPGVLADFNPPVEQLAFHPRAPDEYDLPGIHVEPLPAVLRVLQSCGDYLQVLAALPDMDVGAAEAAGSGR